MFNDTTSTEIASPYIKIPNSPGLYRHAESGRYNAVKKINGTRHERSLRTTDRQIAERRQRDWGGGIANHCREVERTNFEQLMTSFVAAGLSNRRLWMASLDREA